MPHYVNGVAIQIVGNDSENLAALKGLKEENVVKEQKEPKEVKEAPKAKTLKPEESPKKSATNGRKNNA